MKRRLPVVNWSLLTSFPAACPCNLFWAEVRHIEVGGYMDSVGCDETNRTLSENRAGAARDYLLKEAVATYSVVAKGLGNTLRQPRMIILPACRRTGEWRWLYRARLSKVQPIQQAGACAKRSALNKQS
jgi:OmpA family